MKDTVLLNNRGNFVPICASEDNWGLISILVRVEAVRRFSDFLRGGLARFNRS
jgi:hypothetical protein